MTQVLTGLLKRNVAFNVASEVVKNCLPSVALLIDGMSRLTIEGYTHCNAFQIISKLDVS